MKRFLACVLTVAGIGACEGAGPSEAERLASLYGAASAEFGVPQALLESVGYVESGWVEVLEASCHGVMRLCDGASIDRAVKLTGLSADSIRSDSDANIRAAASLLRDAANESSGDAPVEWRQALLLYGDRHDAEWVSSVLDVFVNGASARLPDGSVFGVGGFATRAGESTGTVTGTVFSNEGGCVYTTKFENCEVKLAGATVKLKETGGTATTNANGSFVFTVPYGNYTTRASKAGFEDAEAVLGTRTVDASTPTAYGSIILPKIETATVTGFVYEKDSANLADHSKRLGDATITVGAVTATSAASDGAFALTVPAGTTMLKVSKGGYEEYSETVTLAAGQTLSREIGLVVGVGENPDDEEPGDENPEEPIPSGIDGVVRDLVTGWPVSGVVATIGDDSHSTDAQGAFVFDLPGGAYDVSLQKPGYVVRTLEIEVTEGRREVANIFLNPVDPGALVTITSPTAGSVFTEALIEVRGKVRLGPEPTVKVNGVSATVSGGEFLAYVSLSTGENTLEAVARTDDGRSATASVQVTLVGGANEDGCATAGGVGLAGLVVLLYGVRRRRAA